MAHELTTAPATGVRSTRFAWSAAVVRSLRARHLVLWLAVVYFAALAPFTPGLASQGNLVEILRTLLPLFIVAAGQMVVLITGGIDLSVCSIMALSSVLGALTMNSDSGWLAGSPVAVPVGVAVMLLSGAGVGLLNGLAVAWCRMPPFMVTLATMMFVSGLAVWITHSATIYNLPPAFNALGGRVGPSMGIAVALGLILHVLLTRSLGGRWLYAVGHNARAALVSGVRVGTVTTGAYVASGLCAGLAAVLYTGQAETGSPVLGQRLLLDIIAGTVIGGASLFGGRGTVLGTACGVLFIKLLDNSLNLLNLSLFAITMVKGGVILLAALLDSLRLKLPSREARGGTAMAPTKRHDRQTPEVRPRAGGGGARFEFRQVSRSFGGVRVLNEVSFGVGAGRTVGLVGENGAGKSTLMNLVGGNLQPDTGGMLLNGCAYHPGSPAEATRLGIGFVHQELNLFTNLTIAENLHLTALPRVGPWPLVDRNSLRERTRSLLDRVGLNLDPDTPVERLAAGERQLVEIARALGQETRLLILDEPTTSLSTRETEKLFALLQSLRARGLTMIYISHQLEHVRRLCDDLVVLRDGEVVATGPCADFEPDRLIALMVGRSLSQLFPTRRAKAPVPLAGADSRATVRTSGPTSSAQPRPPGKGLLSADPVPVLEVCNLTQPGLVKDVTFTLHAGEVLGLAGLMGAGRSELARLLFGLEAGAQGNIRLQGQRLAGTRVSDRVRRGLAFLTEDRREEGLCLEASIAENIALVSSPTYATRPVGLLQSGRLALAVNSIRQAVRLTPTARNDDPVSTLSGGNQQKVVLAKWLLARPPVLILDEPTRGIDVGARYDIYQLILELADQGTGVLWISSELEELLGLCDRILVMRRGEIVDEVRRPEFDRERLLKVALGA